MGRIALFLVVVAGAGYLVLDLVVGGILGVPVGRLVAVSLSVILATLLWTVFVWWAADRSEQETHEGGAGAENNG